MAIPRILMQVSLWLIWKIVLTNTMGLAAKSLPDCPDSCGDLVVPYPFGTTENCSLGTRFLIKCSKSDPIPTPFLGNGNLMVTNISLDGEVEILNFVAKDCYKYGQQRNPNKPKLWLSPPYSISNTKNKFFAVGCDTYATIDGYRDNNRYTTGCISSCQQGDMQSLSESCSGVGCCEISIPKGLKNITLNLSSFYNHKYVSSFNPCSFAFLVQKDTFKFNNTIISSGKLDNVTSLPMILNWSIGNVTCEVARTVKNYSCKANSKCVDSSSGSGYICQCFDGYEGNPYHPDGCQGN